MYILWIKLKILNKNLESLLHTHVYFDNFVIVTSSYQILSSSSYFEHQSRIIIDLGNAFKYIASYRQLNPFKAFVTLSLFNLSVKTVTYTEEDVKKFKYRNVYYFCYINFLTNITCT